VVFEVDDAYTALMSAAGAAFVLPETPGKECSHRTCFPISAVVAYELTDAGFTPRTLLTAAQTDVSGTWTVNGSGDQRVALVFELTKRDGARRLNGGRSLLRWRWGDAKVDYRILPGHTDLRPVRTIAESMDFIELRRQSDGERTWRSTATSPAWPRRRSRWPPAIAACRRTAATTPASI
jgi:hypothetical protein